MNLAAVLSGASGGDVFKTLATIAGAIAGIAGIVKFVIVVVNQNEVAVLMSRGRVSVKPDARRILHPGIHLIVPFWQTVVKGDIRAVALDLPPITFDRDEQQYLAKISLVWRIMIEDDMPVRALFGVSNLPETIQNLGANAAREVLKLDTKDIGSLTSEEFDLLMIDRCQERFAHFGVELLSAPINEIARSLGQMIKESGNPRPASILDTLS